MMGSGPYAVPTLRSLLSSRHQVAALVTQPERPAAAGRHAQPQNPMRAAAVEFGLPVLDPESVNTDAAREQLTQLAPDLLVICDYGQILKPEVLGSARLGGINLHASLLPKYRGAAPIQWAVYHGDTETGNTVLHVSPRIDAGALIAQERVAIGPDETAPKLEARLSESGARLVLAAIDDLEAGRATALPQDSAQATRAPRLKKSDGLVDWSRGAAEIRNQIRALKPWPKTYTNWLRDGHEPLRLILEEAHVEEAATAPAAAGGTQDKSKPGEVVASAGDRLIVAAGQGLLVIDRLQPAGKRVMDAAEFLRGYPVRAGDRFG